MQDMQAKIGSGTLNAEDTQRLAQNSETYKKAKGQSDVKKVSAQDNARLQGQSNVQAKKKDTTDDKKATIIQM
jgi:hypothetical protein